ncbi:HK97 gp10 family phage protein [Secundilactobacillus kimchicus]|uniref:HK97 gp10 family phage protein n=1 Tax=Secundilactobacillus kimchicus JCM 15530 TaxID=1302272 RepID=A0A0R1HRI6_9LACO|nr:HK97 gp10 family phage protein [Secundilactobacillus kimchicus]KRK49039.1 hypothetical protein FC96_GL001367 [Secundilactobacillus kimchicus JCM 15530]MBT9671759.1 HK97 gp10 family phage protein [Secundilactobacillus kimchicus]
MSAFFEVGDAEFQAWVQKVQAKANPEAIKREMQTSVKRVGVQAQRTVENVTPVDTGTLRRGWTLSSGGLMAVTLSNGVEYAPFIENGHRTRGGGGWVPGHFMLRDSIKAVESQLGSLITPQFQKVLEGML